LILLQPDLDVALIIMADDLLTARAASMAVLSRSLIGIAGTPRGQMN